MYSAAVCLCFSPSRSHPLLHFRKWKKNHTVHAFSALFGPEGIQIWQSIQSYILSAPTFSISDVTIRHRHWRSTAPGKPKEYNPMLRDEIQETRATFLLICEKNLFSNNGGSMCICVCFCLGLRSWPTHSRTLCNLCAAVWDVSHALHQGFLWKKKMKKKKKKSCQDPDWVNLVSLLTASPVERRPIRNRPFQPKL